MSFINWSSEDDEILINFVRAHEILYNVKHKEYRQTQMKQKLWCEVGKVLNKTDTDCKKRWCYVRDYYNRRKGKPGLGSRRKGAKNRSDRLSFLDSISSSQRNIITSVNEIENPGENTQNSIEHSPFHSQETEDVTFKNEEDFNTDTYHSNEDCNDNNENINKKFEEDRNVKSNLKRKNLLKQIHYTKQYPLNELDENDLFFSSMAKIVKKLPRYEQAQIRMQIGSLVGNAELRYISMDSPAIGVPPRPSTSGSDYSETATSSPVPTIAVNEQGPMVFPQIILMCQNAKKNKRRRLDKDILRRISEDFAGEEEIMDLFRDFIRG